MHNCRYEIENYLSHEGNLTAIISSQGVNPAFPRIFKYYIDLETYAVIRMEFETKIPFGAGFPASYENHASSVIYLKRTFDYKPHKGKYYLNRYHQQVTHQYNNATHQGIDSYQTIHNFHVITNNISSDTDILSNKAELMNYKDQISKTSKSYNANFWKTYNILKQTPLDEKIISDLSKRAVTSDPFVKKD